jgi:hypothetical protein
MGKNCKGRVPWLCMTPLGSLDNPMWECRLVNNQGKGKESELYMTAWQIGWRWKQRVDNSPLRHPLGRVQGAERIWQSGILHQVNSCHQSLCAGPTEEANTEEMHWGDPVRALTPLRCRDQDRTLWNRCHVQDRQLTTQL